MQIKHEMKTIVEPNGQYATERRRQRKRNECEKRIKSSKSTKTENKEIRRNERTNKQRQCRAT